MKRKWLALLLAAILLMIAAASAYASSLSKAELYDAAKTELEKYLNDEATMPLDDLLNRFGELGSYEMSMELALYTNVLCSIEKEDYSLTFVFIGILRQSEAFNAYLEEAQVYGTLDELENYAHGRQAEMMGDMQSALAYYNRCLTFMDSTQRVSMQLVADLSGRYQEALACYGLGTLEGYQKAYELFGELAKYNYSNSAAMMATSKTLLDALLAQMKPASVCGICGAAEECVCADVLSELQAQNDSLNSLLDSDQCTGLCLVHCDDEPSLAKFMTNRTEPASYPIVNESALADGQTCRICAMGDTCTCADQYLEMKAQFELVNKMLSSEGCTGCCTPHCVENLFVVITNSSANIRSGPNSSSEVIGTALFRDTFPYLGEVDNWYKIRAYGQTAYVVKNLSAKTNGMKAMPARPLNASNTSNSAPAPGAPAATDKPTATPCEHSSTRIVEGPYTYFDNGEWLQECYEACNICDDLIDTFFRSGTNVDAAIPTE